MRNWVEAGNPLFPQPLGPFNAPRDVYREIAGFSLADYATDPAVWKTYLRPQFDRLFAAPGYVLAVAPLLALMIFLGFYPKPLTDVITPAVDATLQDAGVTDLQGRPPAVPAEEQ